MYHTEADCRSLIDIYVLFAMEISETIWDLEEPNYIFREREISHTNIPGIGAISGPADYLIGRTSLDISEAHTKSNPVLALPDDRLFVVLEAKKAETLVKDGSQSQLLAQLLTLELAET